MIMCDVFDKILCSRCVQLQVLSLCIIVTRMGDLKFVRRANRIDCKLACSTRFADVIAAYLLSERGGFVCLMF